MAHKLGLFWPFLAFFRYHLDLVAISPVFRTHLDLLKHLDLVAISRAWSNHLDLAATSTSIYEITCAFLGFGLSCSQKYEYQAKLS